MDRDGVEVHKNANRERSHCPDISTELAWSIKDLLYGVKNTEKIIFVVVNFRALKRNPANLTSRFLVTSRRRNRRKSFYCHGKYFAKENFREAAYTSARCYCGNKTGKPERVAALRLARSGSHNHSAVFGSSCPLAELDI